MRGKTCSSLKYGLGAVFLCDPEKEWCMPSKNGGSLGISIWREISSSPVS